MTLRSSTESLKTHSCLTTQESRAKARTFRRAQEHEALQRSDLPTKPRGSLGIPRRPLLRHPVPDLWGGAVDGESGLVWPALRRTIPIGFIVLQAATLGLATPELLEALSGSLVSALLSILQRVYSEARDVPRARSGA